jgi:hypothetical protein
LPGAHPKAGETRGNLAAGGTGVARELSARDREIASTLAPVLAARGLLLVGLDVIGDWLTEINVTSPTCMVEIAEQTGFDAAEMFIAALERQCAAPRLVLPACCVRLPCRLRRAPLHQQEAFVFGTRVEVLIAGLDEAQARPAAAAVLREFDRLHRTYHAWKPSELSA